MVGPTLLVMDFPVTEGVRYTHKLMYEAAYSVQVAAHIRHVYCDFRLANILLPPANIRSSCINLVELVDIIVHNNSNKCLDYVSLCKHIIFLLNLS